MKVECGNCGQHVLVDDSAADQAFACPKCGQTLRATIGSAIPVKEVQTNVKQGAAIGGWVCFGLGAIFMFIPVPTWFIYGPLLLASFILSIVAISQGRVASGVTLLLANVVGGPLLFIMALGVGIATWTGALDKVREQVASHSGTTPTIAMTNSIPVVAESDPRPVDEKLQAASQQKKQEVDEARERVAYIQQHLILYNVEARYMDSVLDGRVPGVLFKVRNSGDRSLDMVEVTIAFKDANGAVIHDEAFKPVLVSDFSFGENKPLKAGYVWQMESGKFYSAKSVPSEWKDGSIDAAITDIRFSKN